MNLRLLKLANSGFLLAKLSGIDLFENVVDSPKGHGCVSNFIRGAICGKTGKT